MHLRELRPTTDEAVAHSLLVLQREAYAVEAQLLGDDRIPALHECLDALRAAPLHWLGALGDDHLLGAVAWSATDALVDVDRLVVSPAAHRGGIGTRLVSHVIDLAGSRDVSVSTGSGNAPARALYERLGFARVDDVEVLPRLWVTRYRLTPSAPRPGRARARTPAR
ncbi:GNAT family N-acetyltransferase [Aquipuribacter nitratireducens]|uniref:GNAT family N-acetyltransferase n=1 Tax=Aquipuribacter nitratireducens TaxID=650104 RepID=A0ABW0GJQ0_9MICO